MAFREQANYLTGLQALEFPIQLIAIGLGGLVTKE